MEKDINFRFSRNNMKPSLDHQKTRIVEKKQRRKRAMKAMKMAREKCFCHEEDEYMINGLSTAQCMDKKSMSFVYKLSYLQKIFLQPTD